MQYIDYQLYIGIGEVSICAHENDKQSHKQLKYAYTNATFYDMVEGHKYLSSVKCHIVNFEFTRWVKIQIYKLSYCKFCIFTHPINFKFTIWHTSHMD